MSNLKDLLDPSKQPGDEPTHPQFVMKLPKREALVAYQIDTLVGVASMAHRWATAARDGTDYEGTKLDGGLQQAATETFIKTCEAINRMVEDKSRWSMVTQGVLEKELGAAYKEQAKLMKIQQEVAAEINTPAYRFRPQLVRMASGEWVAILGSVHDKTNQIIGVGKCPEDALKDFNKVFQGKTKSEKLTRYLDRRENEVRSAQNPNNLSSCVWGEDKEEGK